MSIEAFKALDRLTQIALDNTSEDAHEAVYEDAKRVRAEWEASRKVEAAPSDADREALEHECEWECVSEMEHLERAYDGLKVEYAEYRKGARTRPSQPVQVEVTERAVATLAKHMANVASDWVDNCDDDDHSLEHSNWGAYMDDARRALVAALGGGDQ